MNPFSIEIRNGLIERSEPADRFRLSVNGTDVPLPGGAIILPGFVDTHCHLIGPGMMAERIDLRAARSAAECADLVAREAAGRGAGEWILGFGWNQEGWTDPELFTRRSLDAAAPDNPVALYRIDTHAAWVNSAALERGALGVESKIDGGEVVLAADGSPLGLLIDEAVKALERSMPAPTGEQIARWYRYGAEECLRYGITEVHDMTVAPEWLDPLTGLAERGGLPLRCRAFPDGKEERWRCVPRPTVLAKNLDTVGVKFFSDGALGSRGAFLLEPYRDAPETRGIATITTEELAEYARPAIEAGYAIATHAIGDAANRLVLDAYERLRPDYPDALLRIEHAQILHPDDIPRFAALKVIPVVQPIHCTSDAAMALERLGPECCAGAYAWRSLRDTGVPLLGGSDFPIESPDPLLGLNAFVRREAEGTPWYPEQRISRREALNAYTEWAVLGVPGPRNRGRLEPGCDADLVVLSGDPFAERTEVIMTMVGGEFVFR